MSSAHPEVAESARFYELLGWLDQNKKSLAIGFVVILILAFGIAAYRWNAQQTEAAANEALLKLRSPLNPGPETPTTPASEYLKVAAEYPSTEAADRAVLLAAGEFFAESKFADAQAQFERYLAEHPEGSLAPMAAYGVAASQEAQGKTDQALSAYQSLQTRYPRSTVLDDAKLATARIHEVKGQPDLALKTYDELSGTNFVGSARTTALQRKEALLKLHPNLAKPVVTNTVPAPAPSVIAPAPAPATPPVTAP